jgi:hypothetical protein
MFRRSQPIADEIIGAYVEWREHAQAVWDAYNTWCRSEGHARDIAFCVYRVVLSDEHCASERYAEIIRRAHSPAPVIAEHLRSVRTGAQP